MFHNALYALAFLNLDSAAMAEQQQWFAGKPVENWGPAVTSDTEAYAGRIGKARGFTKQAVDSAIRTDSKERRGTVAGDRRSAGSHLRISGRSTESQRLRP